jgi:hypothetical protein
VPDNVWAAVKFDMTRKPKVTKKQRAYFPKGLALPLEQEGIPEGRNLFSLERLIRVLAIRLRNPKKKIPSRFRVLS